MQLQAFLQHLFLHSPQENDVGREETGQGDDLAAHAQHLVDDRRNARAAPEPIAEIDKPVARRPALGKRFVQALAIAHTRLALRSNAKRSFRGMPGVRAGAVEAIAAT
jgi:hypothetical protein